MVYFIYNLFLLLLLPLLLLAMVSIGRYRAGLGERFGFIPKEVREAMKGEPRIWVNGVSVGEVVVISSLIKALKVLYPSSCILLSTTTKTGKEMARKVVEGASSFIYYPLDLPWVVRRAMRIVSPHIFITSEMELWPNFQRMAKMMGAKTMLVNGRVSNRSWGKYRMTRFLWRRVLENVDTMSMISDLDAERIESMGADPERIIVTGNLKYDYVSDQTKPRYEREMRDLFNIWDEEMAFLAASTHKGEDGIVIEAYRGFLERFPNMVFIIVPRHPERKGEVQKLLRDYVFNDSILGTEIKKGKKRGNEKVIILDTIGELFKVYSLATLVFCGGSLVPKGGQNILEPASWGKVVLYGPSMDDFLDAKGLLEGVGAGIEVRNIDELLQRGMELLTRPGELKRRGQMGREVIYAHQGSAKRNAELAKKLLEGIGV